MYAFLMLLIVHLVECNTLYIKLMDTCVYCIVYYTFKSGILL